MDSVLRDINRERSKMLADIANLERHYEKLVGFVHQYLEQATIEWARLVASHPKATLLVVETTRIVDELGYTTYGDSEPIRFTTLPLVGGEIWDQLLCPTHGKGVQGSAYHGLTMADLSDKPRLADVWPDIAEQLEGRHILIFGADWTRGALRSVLHSNMLDGAFCLHNKAKEYYSEFYELSLEKILSHQGIDKKREQLTDSRERILMLAQVVHNLAAGMAKQTQEQEAGESFDSGEGLLDDLDSHPF